MFQRSGSTGRNHRNGYTICNCPCQFQIISGLRSVTVHTRQKNLTCAKGLYFLRPLNRIDSDIQTSTVLINIPSCSVCSFLRVNRHYYTLASKLLCRFTDQLRSVDCRRID